MPHVICEPCVGVKDAACVGVCPVDAIHPTPDEGNFNIVNQLFIDPQQCTDCAACVGVCPVGAIFDVSDVPSQWQQYIQINAQYYGQ